MNPSQQVQYKATKDCIVFWQFTQYFINFRFMSLLLLDQHFHHKLNGLLKSLHVLKKPTFNLQYSLTSVYFFSSYKTTKSVICARFWNPHTQSLIQSNRWQCQPVRELQDVRLDSVILNSVISWYFYFYYACRVQNQHNKLKCNITSQWRVYPNIQCLNSHKRVLLKTDILYQLSAMISSEMIEYQCPDLIFSSRNDRAYPVNVFRKLHNHPAWLKVKKVYIFEQAV